MLALPSSAPSPDPPQAPSRDPKIREGVPPTEQRGQVREFWLTGPFGAGMNLHMSFPPEWNPNPKMGYVVGAGEKRSWKKQSTNSAGLLRVAAPLPNDRGFYYALAYIRSPAAGKATMLLGSGDRVRVWVNRQPVHESDRPREARPDADRIEVPLNKGWNMVLVKLGGRDRPTYDLSLRFLGDGLRFSLKPSD